MRDYDYVVNYWHNEVLRVVGGPVSRATYMQLWRERRLEFQLPGTKKRQPSHLPTLETLEKEDRDKKERDEAIEEAWRVERDLYYEEQRLERVRKSL